MSIATRLTKACGRQTCSVMLCAVILGMICSAGVQQGQPEVEQTGSLPFLFKVLRENVGLSGDIVRSLDTQKRLAELGKQEPKRVVPAIVGELKAAQSSHGKMSDYRMALISVLEEMGPAAEAAVPILREILQDERERNDFVLLKVRMALTAIGTPPARQSATTAEQKNVESWLQKASPQQVAEAVAQHSYFIRRELRSSHMSEEVIKASAAALLPMGRQATDAAPTLLRAWQDPRIGEKLRSLITRVLSATGVGDIEAASKLMRRLEPGIQCGNASVPISEPAWNGIQARSKNALERNFALKVEDRGAVRSSLVGVGRERYDSDSFNR